MCCFDGCTAPRILVCCGVDEGGVARACSRIFGSCGARFCCARLKSNGSRSNTLLMDDKPFAALGKTWSRDPGWRQDECNVSAGLKHALHFCTAVKAGPTWMACIGLVALVVAPFALVGGSALEASGAAPASLWWLWFLPLFFACACCTFAPGAAACFGEMECEGNTCGRYIVGSIIAVVAGCPCLFALTAAISLSLGAGNELPAWAVLLPIWIWIGLAAGALCLLCTVASTCLPLVLCVKNDNECERDYCCAPCNGDGEERAMWAVFNVLPAVGMSCVLLPISATAVLGCLKFTDGFRDAIPAWLIGLPIVLSLVVVAIPLCVLGACLYKRGFAKMEGHLKAGSVIADWDLAGCLCAERVGAIHKFWTTVEEEEEWA